MRFSQILGLPIIIHFGIVLNMFSPMWDMVIWTMGWVKVSKSRKRFLKSSIFQNLTQKIWRISALCTSGQESFKFLGSNFGKLMISKIAFEIYWPLACFTFYFFKRREINVKRKSKVEWMKFTSLFSTDPQEIQSTYKPLHLSHKENAAVSQKNEE